MAASIAHLVAIYIRQRTPGVVGGNHSEGRRETAMIRVADTAPEESTPTQPPATDGSGDQQIDDADEATRSVEILDPEWNEQAVRFVRAWMDPIEGRSTDLSRQGQLEQMTTYTGFTKEEAEYGFDNWDR